MNVWMKMFLEFQEKKKKNISTLLALFNVDMTGTIHIKKQFLLCSHVTVVNFDYSSINVPSASSPAILFLTLSCLQPGLGCPHIELTISIHSRCKDWSRPTSLTSVCWGYCVGEHSTGQGTFHQIRFENSIFITRSSCSFGAKNSLSNICVLLCPCKLLIPLLNK